MLKRDLNLRYIAASVAAIISFIAYIGATRNEFVNWDDDMYVYNNIHIRALDLSLLRWAFTEFYAANWHPITWISHSLDYALWGLNPSGHHLTSIIIHSINSFLIVLLSVHLLKMPGSIMIFRNTVALPAERARLLTAALTGIYFGIHPLHVESVVWIAERKDVLCAFFFLSSLFLYLRFVESDYMPSSRDSPTKALWNKYYIGSIFMFLLSLFSKPMAVTLPVVLLFLDWYPLKRFRWGCIQDVLLEKIPFLLLSLFSSFITIQAQRSGDALISIQNMPLLSRVATAFHAIFVYVAKLVLPIHLIPYYEYPREISILSPKYLFPLFFVAVVSVASIIYHKKVRGWLVIWSTYIVMLIPVIGIVQVGGQAMAERYTYLPTIGLLLMASLGMTLLVDVLMNKTGIIIAYFVPCFVVLCFMILTMWQTKVWKNSEEFWTYVVRVQPSSSVAHDKLGLILFKKHQLKEALHLFETAIALDPTNFYALNNLALCYLEAQQYDAAWSSVMRAIYLRPTFANAHSTLGEIWFAMEKYQQALESFQTALKLGSSSPTLYYNMAVTLDRTGQIQEACGYLGIYSRSDLNPVEHKETTDYMRELGCQ